MLRNANDCWDICTRTRPLNSERFEYEHICYDPRDGELCMRRVCSGEYLMEARSDTDVQILVVVANTQMRNFTTTEKGSMGAAVGHVLADHKRQGCSTHAGFAPSLEMECC